MPSGRNKTTGSQKDLAFRWPSKISLEAWRAARRAEADAAAVTEDRAGYVMNDGTLYAGVSPDTNRPMFVLPVSEAGRMEWREASQTAEKKEACGHRDWRVPTEGELTVLFNNRAVLGGFCTDSSYSADWYWSSTQDKDQRVRGRRFGTGRAGFGGRGSVMSLRLVRG